ncbi:MAG: hypothetical protein E7361_03260 [Clostridiales bacterium]|nr:hypothetical protein [Clostridiales bacterium]
MVEVTVEVLNTLDEIKEILYSAGYKIVVEYDMNDWYYSTLSNKELLKMPYIEIINNSFIVREVIEDCKYNLHLCYKSKTLDENQVVIAENKIVSPLLYRDVTLKLFDNAGINNWCEVKTHMLVYEKGGEEFAIQIVEDLGIFLEYESEKTEISDPYLEIEELKGYVKKTGLKLGNDYSEKKVYRKFLKENK